MQAVSVSIPGSSFSSRESGRSQSMVVDEASSSGCSSLAPYWIPEEIKHYFVHHHSEAAKRDYDSRIADKALRDIGLERELSTGDGSHWSKWSDPCLHVPRSTFQMFVAVITAALSVALFVSVVTEYRNGLLSHVSVAPTVVSLKNEIEGTGGPPVIMGKNGDSPLPAPPNEGTIEKELQEITVAGELAGNLDYGMEFPKEVTSQDHIAVREHGSAMADEEMVVKPNLLRREKVQKITGTAWANLRTPITKEACRTTPVFTLCSRGSSEFFYDHSHKACVAAASNRLGVCNRGPNRFTSKESCRRRCVDSRAAAAECHGGALFAECQTRDILQTWWYSDGKRCRQWPFPRGRCPGGGKDEVFRTSAECVRRCLSRNRHRPCHTPKLVVCDPKHLRFAYYADASPDGLPARRCRQIPAAAETQHYCLAGSNRFPTLSACRKTCLRDHAAYHAKV